MSMTDTCDRPRLTDPEIRFLSQRADDLMVRVEALMRRVSGVERLVTPVTEDVTWFVTPVTSGVTYSRDSVPLGSRARVAVPVPRPVSPSTP